MFLIPAIAFFLVTVLLCGFIPAFRSGMVGRNHTVGIRTRATLRSEAAWVAGHRAVVPYLVASAIIAGLAGIAVLLGSLQGGDPLWLNVVTLSGWLLIMITVLIGARAAQRAARGAPEDTDVAEEKL